MPAQARKRPFNTRRTFLVKDQLVGKLGPRGFSSLLDQLQAVTVEDAKPRRRHRRRRKPVAA